MTSIESHYGLMVSPMATSRGTVVYAEIEPAPRLLRWIGFHQWSGLRKYIPFHNGRSLREPHIRWWFEIHETAEFGEECGTHWWEHDGGAITLRQVIRKANQAVSEVVETIRKEKETNT